MKIGFIGLGIMGSPMAQHLLAAQHEMFIRTRSKVPAELATAHVCATNADVARAADIIFLMLPDTPDVQAVLFGKDGVAEGLSQGKIVVDMSSISPMDTKAFAQKINTLGCEYLIMVGGAEATFNTVKPLFELMGKNITLVGGNGDGQTTKVANQIIVALNIAAVGEALLFASKAGADPAKVRAALMGGFASSRILEVHGERMIKRTFDPGFRIALHQKDLALALTGAKAIGVSLPQTASAAQLMQACSSNGWGQMDHSALVKSLELMAAHEVATS
jgi:2-hydroxy-3-oxopropionate reductase